MNITSLLDGAARQDPSKTIANAFGVAPERAEQAIAVLGNALADRIERNTLSRGGIADLVDLLARPGAGTALGESAPLNSPHVEAVGNSILEVLIGSKHTSRGLAARAAKESGIDVETVKKMLPAVASMLIGALQAKSMPQIEKSLAGTNVPGLKAAPLPLPGEKGSTPLNFPQTSSTGRSGSPLPLPGDDIPGIDGPSRFPDLPDVIRRRGRQIEVPQPGGSGTGSLDEVIRQILANVLGFKNTGILGFLLKIIFSRWFMGLITRILFRR